MMKLAPLQIASLIALAATIVPSLLYFAGLIGHDAVNVAALVGTIAWFIVTPIWMGRTASIDDQEVQI